jgi:hypothetical protein
LFCNRARCVWHFGATFCSFQEHFLLSLPPIPLQQRKASQSWAHTLLQRQISNPSFLPHLLPYTNIDSTISNHYPNPKFDRYSENFGVSSLMALREPLSDVIRQFYFNISDILTAMPPHRVQPQLGRVFTRLQCRTR